MSIELCSLFFLLGLGTALVAFWWVVHRPLQQQYHQQQLAHQLLQAKQAGQEAECLELREKGQQHEAIAHELITLKAQHAALEASYCEAKTQWQQTWKQEAELHLTKLVETQREAATQQLKHTEAERQERLKELTTPIATMLKAYEEKIAAFEQHRHADTAVLKDKIEQLVHSKDQLVAVLQHNKAVGDWGELQLVRLLESCGLQEHTHYQFQPQMGDKKRPDFKILMPQNRYIIVDAKTLQFGTRHYGQGMEATEGMPLEEATQWDEVEPKRLVASIRAEVKSLADKDYTKEAEGGATPDFVVMFLPKESMLARAVEQDPHLWEEAYRKNVILSSPFTLLALLRMVEAAWRQERLAANMQEIQKLGRTVHEKLMLVAERFVKVESQLGTLTKSVAEWKTGFEGNQGLVKYAQQLKDYGCGSPKELPKALEGAEHTLVLEETPTSAPEALMVAP